MGDWREPMGFHTSGNAYTRGFDDITANQPRKVRCVDCFLLWDDNIEEAFWQTFDYLKTCGDDGIILNEDKFKFAQEVAEFAGFEITMEGYRPLKRILDAVKRFPTLKNGGRIVVRIYQPDGTVPRAPQSDNNDSDHSSNCEATTVA